MIVSGVVIDGLKELRRDLRRAADATPKEATAAVREAGMPVLRRAQQLAPRREGTLAGSGRLRTSGTRGFIEFRAPYAGGAEWGRKGKWKGFTRKWGYTPRYGHKALAEKEDEVARIIMRRLEDIVTAHGWFRG